jgi:hypothetical protein
MADPIINDEQASNRNSSFGDQGDSRVKSEMRRACHEWECVEAVIFAQVIDDEAWVVRT